VTVDLHFHLLPGVDDGPETLAESVALARAAVGDGSSTVVATPHVRPDFVTDVYDLPERVRELQGALDAEGIQLEVLCGGELGHDMVGSLRQHELDTIAQGPPRARWLLVEAPFEGFGADLRAATDELGERGFGVLIGHPERSADALLDDGAGLRRELRRGSSAQVSALSLTGRHGWNTRRAALELILGGGASVLASDAHGITRPPALGIAREHLLRLGLHPALARRLTLDGPRRLLARGIPRPALVAV
jgi:protein-tyrosine phosphatase